MSAITSPPQLRKHLLWELDPERLDFDAMSDLMIERVVERGDLADWREMLRYYGARLVLDTVSRSTQLSQRDKEFVNIFIKSPLVHVSH